MNPPQVYMCSSYFDLKSTFYLQNYLSKLNSRYNFVSFCLLFSDISVNIFYKIRNNFWNSPPTHMHTHCSLY